MEVATKMPTALISRLECECRLKHVLDDPHRLEKLASAAATWLAKNQDRRDVCQTRVRAVELLLDLTTLALEGRIEIKE